MREKHNFSRVTVSHNEINYLRVEYPALKSLCHLVNTNDTSPKLQLRPGRKVHARVSYLDLEGKCHSPAVEDLGSRVSQLRRRVPLLHINLYYVGTLSCQCWNTHLLYFKVTSGWAVKLASLSRASLV